jgi:hypothetical protein
MNSIITITLYGNKKLDVTAKVMSVFVQHEVNVIPTAELTLVTGDFASRTYPLFDNAMFNVGEELDIRVEYAGAAQGEKSIFIGIVTDRKFESREGMPVMILGLKDPAFRVTGAIDTTLFSNKNDAEMITKTLSAAKGLSLNNASPTMTSFSFGQFVRKQTTGWQFILDRVRAHGALITLNNGAMTISAPSDTVGELTLNIGIDNILGVSIKEDASDLAQQIVLHYWNAAQNKVEVLKKSFISANAKAIIAPISNYDVFGITTKAEAQAMLNFFTNRQELGQVLGTIRMPGDASVKVMQELTLKSLPASLNGSYPITKVLHKISEGIWTTTIGIGIGSNTIKPLDEDAQQVPQAFDPKDVEVAKAMKWEKDPETLGRVPVQIPAFGTGKYWAYPPQTAAGTKQRSFILPEEGAQLVVGFLYNNYNMGVILTSLYLGADVPKTAL